MISAGLVVITWLNSVGHTAASRTDIGLQGVLPFVRVVQLGGQRTLTLGKPTVDVEYFAATELAALTGMGTVDDLLNYQLPGTVVAGAVVQGVRSVALPSSRPYENQNVWRYGATYQLLMHDLQPAG